MKKSLMFVILGASCLYAATSIWSLRHHCTERGHEDHEHNKVTSGHTPKIDIAAAVGVENLVDIVTLGSGPAGLSACVYGCRAGRHVVCFEGYEPGGLLMTTKIVENWPGEKSILGPDIVQHIHEQAENLGAYFVQDKIVAVDFSQYPYRLESASGLVVHALSVIVATGATPKKLGIPGEEIYWERGVSSCAVCSGAFFEDKNVVVVGGGDSAIEEAIQLTPYARSITIMVRGDAMRAAVLMQAHLKEYPSISVRYNIALQEIVGGENGVTGIVVRDNKSGIVAQESIDGVFLAIGHTPNVDMLGGQVALCKTGQIALCSRSQETSVPGVFAAGDVADPDYRQAGVAAGDGIKAALDADRFLVEYGYSPAIASQFDAHRFYPKIEKAPSLIKNLETLDQLNAALTPQSGLVLFDFYTDECSLCKYMMPHLEGLAQEYRDNVAIYAINSGIAHDIAAHLKIKGVPTLMIFYRGQLRETIEQPLDSAQLNALIIRNLAQ